MSGALANRVAVVSRPGVRYCDEPPFDPPNPVYEAVEATFVSLGLDRGRAGTPDWNPLGDLIAPGDRVIVKPNLVSSKNLHQRLTGRDLAASSTHGSVLRPVLDYVLRAVGPRGEVRVVDAPVEGCAVKEVAGPLGVFEVIDHLRRGGHDVEFLDLRTFCVVPVLALDDVRRRGRSWNLGVLVRRRLPGDPRGHRIVDLGDESRFAVEGAPPGARLRFHRSHYETPVIHHMGGRHEYSLPRTVLDADVVIHLAKLKTHKKTGVTLSLKSVIGLTNEKYWLPHFAAGDPSVGGDEFDRRPSRWQAAENKLSRLPLPCDNSLIARAPRLDAPPRIVDGSWEGNRTLWRTIVDLNRILHFADRDGRIRDVPQRRLLTLVDGLLAGEGDGPLGATPVDAGLIVAGTDPALVDAVAARAMGFDPLRIVHIREALDGGGRLSEVNEVRSGEPSPRTFRAPRSWPSLTRR